MIRCRRQAEGLVPTVLIGLLSACTPPAEDVPYIAGGDTLRMVAAIDEALVNDRDVAWQSEASDAQGTAVLGDIYRDRLDRHCRNVTYSVTTADGAYTQTAGYCRSVEGDWVPDLPPGAGSSIQAVPDKPATGSDISLRREMNIKMRRFERRGDTRAEARRKIRRLYTLEERRRAGF